MIKSILALIIVFAGLSAGTMVVSNQHASHSATPAPSQYTVGASVQDDSSLFLRADTNPNLQDIETVK